MTQEYLLLVLIQLLVWLRGEEMGEMEGAGRKEKNCTDLGRKDECMSKANSLGESR